MVSSPYEKVVMPFFVPNTSGGDIFVGMTSSAEDVVLGLSSLCVMGIPVFSRKSDIQDHDILAQAIYHKSDTEAHHMLLKR